METIEEIKIKLNQLREKKVISQFSVVYDKKSGAWSVRVIP